MQWIPCSMMECSGFNAAWPNASRLNAVDFMQHGPKHLHWMCGFHSLWLNSVCSMQRVQMHPDWMQWSLCSVKKWNPIECSGFYAAWFNAVDSMQHVWMQWILCSMAQSIPIECSGFHAASLNEEDSMHCGAKDPDCMQWSRCSEAQIIPIECSGFHALWVNSDYSMQRGKMHP